MKDWEFSKMKSWVVGVFWQYFTIIVLYEYYLLTSDTFHRVLLPEPQKDLTSFLGLVFTFQRLNFAIEIYLAK